MDPFAGRSVLVTGASSGIGTAFAEHAAGQGARLVLVARRRDRLDALAESLHRRTGATVEVLAQDLADPDAGARVVDALAGRQVDVLVNNAGIGAHGDLSAADPAALAEQVRLNVGAVTDLTVRLLPPMLARGRGLVVNVASTAAFQPVPHMAVYAATKAYVLSFTQALWGETRGTGVQALAVCPGATDTEFFDHVGDAASVGRRRRPEDVVATTLRALRRGRPSVVDGRANAVLARTAVHLPEAVAIRAAERSVRAR